MGSETGNQRRPAVWLAAILMVLVAVLYARVLRYDFVNVDDNLYVTENPRVMSGLTPGNLVWAFKNDNAAGMWIPLTWMSLQCDATLSGTATQTVLPRRPALPGAPAPFPPATIFHLNNVLLQMLAAGTLFLFLYRATRARWAAFAVVFFWVIHPLRVESVAWITERKDVLAGLFGFLTMYLYVEWVRRSGWQRYALTCAAYALCLMAKPMFVTLPFLLVLLDGWPLGRLRSTADVFRRVIEKWVMFLFAVGVSVLTVLGQRQISGMKHLADLGMGQRIEHGMVSYVMYLVRHIQVWDLAVYYPYGKPPGVGLTVLCAAVLVAVTAICVQQMRRRPWLLVGWLWYLGAMFPVSGIAQSGEQGYADRFTYLPSIGLWIMIVFTVWDALARKRAGEAAGRWSVPKVAVMAMGGIFAVVMIGFTWRQVGYWQNTFTLGERTLAVTKDNWFMHQMMGVAYEREGENEEAEEHYAKATEIEPRVSGHWFQLGFLHLRLEQNEKAMQELARAAKLKPMDMRAHFFHGLALERMGHRDGAIMEYYNALKLEPGNQNVASTLEKAVQDPAALEAAIRHVPELEKYRGR